MDVVGPAEALARSLLEVPLPRRWRHVQGVARTAELLCDGLCLDRDTVIAAAWLHDVGYAPHLRETGLHALDGARHLRDAGWPIDVCGLVAHHTAAHVEAAACGLGGSLEADFPDVPSLERDVLWVADATTGPDGQPMTIDARIVEVSERYGADHLVARAMCSSSDELRAAAGRVEQLRRDVAAG